MIQLGRAFFLLSVIAKPVLAANTIVEISRNDFSESYAESVEVSGSVLASSFVSGSVSHPSPDQLYVFVPSYRPNINFVLTTIDGRYSADASLTLQQSQTGWIQIKLPTNHKNTYAEYLPTQLVVFAYADSEDRFGNYVQEVFPTSWGSPVPSTLNFLINSAGISPNVTFVDHSGSLITRDCQKIEAEYTRVFNHICHVEKSDFTSGKIFTFSPNNKDSGKNYIIWSEVEN